MVFAGHRAQSSALKFDGLALSLGPVKVKIGFDILQRISLPFHNFYISYRKFLIQISARKLTAPCFFLLFCRDGRLRHTHRPPPLPHPSQIYCLLIVLPFVTA
jgi:hypothetical protein